MLKLFFIFGEPFIRNFKYLYLAFVLSVLADDCQKGQYKNCEQSIYECCDAAFQKSIGITNELCSEFKKKFYYLINWVLEGTTAQNPQCVQDALDLAFYGN